MILTLIAGTGSTLFGNRLAATITLYENSGDAEFKLVGTPEVGQTLSLTKDDPDGNGVIGTRIWESRSPGGSWLNIVGQTSKTYVIPANLVGLQLRANVD